jgi:hypothetical protein
MRNIRKIPGLWLLILLGAQPAPAHHSFAMYDPKQVLTLNGTVKEFQWSNPHAIVWVLVPTANEQEPQLWSIELPTSPAGLVRMGWDKHSLNSGDQVVLEINPLRDGEHAGSFKKATLVASGKVLAVALPSIASAQAAPPRATATP